MPFTLSHPAAVVVLRRTGLPMSGLVCGSMVPDVPMLTRIPYGYGLAHSLRGVVTVDLLVGVSTALAWTLLVRDAVVDAGPIWVRNRVGPGAGVR